MKTRLHYIDPALLSPANPISVILIGAGGTGSHLLQSLASMDHALYKLGHAGLEVSLWDDDTITEANIGRQLYYESETGMPKAVALINRANLCYGTRWQAVTRRFAPDANGMPPKGSRAMIYISCVDTVAARFGIAEVLRGLDNRQGTADRPVYWLDTGNATDRGQALLSTIGKVTQPVTKDVTAVVELPFITESYGELLRESETGDDTPSCSMAEALEKQDLFINPAIAKLSCALLWSLLRNGVTANRGFFLDLSSLRSQPIPV